MFARECFEYWYRMPEPERSWAKAASQFDIPEGRLKKWAKDFMWKERARERDSEVANKIAISTVETVVQTKIRMLDKVRKVIDAWFAQHMDATEIDDGKGGRTSKLAATMAFMEPDTVLKFMKLYMDILGHQDVGDMLNGEKKVDGITGGKLTVEELRAFLNAVSQQTAIDAKPVELDGSGRVIEAEVVTG